MSSRHSRFGVEAGGVDAGVDARPGAPAATDRRTPEAYDTSSHTWRGSTLFGDLFGGRSARQRWATLAGMLVALLIGIALRDPIGAGMGAVGSWITSDDDHDHDGSADGSFWTCGMHPWVILPSPGLCPICHMELTPLDPAKLSAEIAIDPVVVQNIGVRVAPVAIEPLEKQIRTVGTIAYDEESVRVVNTKIGGWIEKLYANETGVLVNTGDPLFELYSPKLFAAQQEYVSAYQNRGLPGGEELLRAARTRLEYFDVSARQVRRLEQTGTPRKTLAIASPHTGFITQKRVNEGMRVEPGMAVYELADLSRVWVQATIYEQDLPFVVVGQRAVMTLPYLANRTFEGEVAYIYPFLDEKARQARVRLEFENPDGLLKPGMFATVRLQRTLEAQAVVVPRDAVVVTGERQVAFVALGNGRFEPRELELGIQTEDGRVQVLDGLAPGERVVTSGQFMLDSEAKMRLALAKMVEENGGDAPDDVPDPHADHTKTSPPLEPMEGAADAERPMAMAPAALLERERVRRLLSDYLELQGQLVSGNLQRAVGRLAALNDAARDLANVEDPQVRELASRIAAAASAPAEDIASVRETFEGLSAAVIELAERTGTSGEATLYRAYCPMVDASWLQTSPNVQNPYFGAASNMATCGSIEPFAGNPGR